jgi:sugar transferase (PEP-CTERM/EpsH1 system associated)
VIGVDDLLFLSQRIPFPPDKGDKIRSFHALKHLAERFRIHLGCFIDDPADEKYVTDLNTLCASVHIARLSSATKMLRGLRAFATGTSITEARFIDPGMAQWVKRTVAGNSVRNIFAFGSAMVPLAENISARKVLDIVDVDSEKWRSYALDAAFPMSAIYAREAEKVLAMERRGATAFDHALFVSEAEVGVFLRRAPEAAGRASAMQNGVDTAYFDPAAVTGPSPFPVSAKSIVFTGTMNYRPNIDAVAHFARDVLPAVLSRTPDAQFWIVGAQPSRRVKALADGSAIHVTGAVPDIRPYLRYADCVVAPLAIARGVQNKVLEAMAMARPVVASTPAAEGISAKAGEDLVVADGPAFAAAACDVLAGRHGGLGERAQARVNADYRWASNLKILDILFS